jgi:hypothetical protein
MLIWTPGTLNFECSVNSVYSFFASSMLLLLIVYMVLHALASLMVKACSCMCLLHCRPMCVNFETMWERLFLYLCVIMHQLGSEY